MSTLRQSSRDPNLSPVPVGVSTHYGDSLLHIERETKYIQGNLQALIDAQSDGLLSGLAVSGTDQASSKASTPSRTTNTSRSVSQLTVPTRQPAPKKITLHSAREGIFQSIYDLLKLREEEREIVTSQSNERSQALEHIEDFLSKRSGLEEAITTIQSENESQRSKQLEEEAQHLQADIHELETKLYEMKAKHRHLVNQISQINNSVDAKLSSYTRSLSLLDSDIRKYLHDPPIQPLSRRRGESSFHSLNPKRRTLDMAQEHWKTEQVSLRSRQQEVDAEIQALEEGGGAWKQTIHDVTCFEKRLRVKMRQYVELATTEPEAMPADYNEGIVTSILDDLDKTTCRIESHLELAEDKDWKLLVCCIAAELEALRAARGMLLPAFGLSAQETDAPSNSPGDAQDPDAGQEHARADSLENDDPEPPADLLSDANPQRSDAASRSEDDEPDPSWLS